ncbi:MAG: cytochrome C oxidase Cbb3, partial [Myxococcales bacterium]|nr:cytochrome C oxidase Cbb3 [Myxococcales bacterium]
RICVHCHMHPDSNNGDGGAGNTGGLGFAGLGLNLETYDGVREGLLRDGKRVSVIAPPAPGEAPLLYQALARRHTEFAAGGVASDAKRLGMPLGLPPLSGAQMRLVRTWLAQGAPGPK